MKEIFKTNGRAYGNVRNLTSVLEEKGNFEFICQGCKKTVKDDEQETVVIDYGLHRWRWFCDEDCRELFYKM